MDQLKITVHENEDAPEGPEIVRSLVAFNESVAVSSNHKAFVVSAKDENGRFVAGVKGYTHWGWLFVSHLWVDESQKGKGLGSLLMDTAEELGKGRGCKNAWLDTFSFQALPFYKKAGYEEFAHLDDYPPGASRYFLRKKL